MTFRALISIHDADGVDHSRSIMNVRTIAEMRREITNVQRQLEAAVLANEFLFVSTISLYFNDREQAIREGISPQEIRPSRNVSNFAVFNFH